MADNRQKFEIYRRVFGWRAYWFAVKSRLTAAPYEAVVRASEGPIILRLKTSDIYAYYKVIVAEDYSFPVSAPPKVIVDAGANIGFASIYFARKFPSARIYAIEPERTNFELLQRNVRPFQNVHPIRGALWNTDGTMDLVDPGEGHWAFQVRGNGLAGTMVEQVRTFTVTTFMREQDLEFIDLFKVDIEGAEKELFEAPQGWIDRVGSFMIELHDRYKPGCTDAFNSATATFPFTQTKGENIFRSRLADAAARPVAL